MAFTFSFGGRSEYTKESGGALRKSAARLNLRPVEAALRS